MYNFPTRVVTTENYPMATYIRRFVYVLYDIKVY